jgi:hypothetical protein
MYTLKNYKMLNLLLKVSFGEGEPGGRGPGEVGAAIGAGIERDYLANIRMSEQIEEQTELPIKFEID